MSLLHKWYWLYCRTVLWGLPFPKNDFHTQCLPASHNFWCSTKGQPTLSVAWWPQQMPKKLALGKGRVSVRSSLYPSASKFQEELTCHLWSFSPWHVFNVWWTGFLWQRTKTWVVINFHTAKEVISNPGDSQLATYIKLELISSSGSSTHMSVCVYAH